MHGCKAISLLCTIMLSACGGLNITPCINDINTSLLICSDKDKKVTKLTYLEANSFICFSPNDTRTIYETCRKAPAIINVCLLDGKNETLYCSDKDKELLFIPMSEAINYVCFSDDDTRTIFEYCSGLDSGIEEI